MNIEPPNKYNHDSIHQTDLKPKTFCDGEHLQSREGLSCFPSIALQTGREKEKGRGWTKRDLRGRYKQDCLKFGGVKAISQCQLCAANFSQSSCLARKDRLDIKSCLGAQQRSHLCFVFTCNHPISFAQTVPENLLKLNALAATHSKKPKPKPKALA
ncbi:hypothetical protein F0562_014264 [Nyssa sinensis]|uniref:Uncharacterized protein n=1 Tax=Nyssa sinensis TaxID=561372 RepID=A0A5J4ZQM8_9ASTE|nr:hypothetical protein F0562_014264 [Nyssa sinensis]